MERPMPMGGKTLLEQASAFAVQCDFFASMEALSAAVAALVAPFGYPNVASGILGNPGTARRRCISPTGSRRGWTCTGATNFCASTRPIWAANCGAPVDIGQLCAQLPKGHQRARGGQTVRHCGRVYRPAAGCRQPVRGGRFCRPHGPEQRRGTLRSARSCRRGVRSRRGAERPGAASQRAPAPPEFSARERECLLHLIDGRSTAFIARRWT